MQKNKKISEELKTEMHELHRDFHDLYPLHTPSNEEDRETGFGSVATEEEKADPVKATTEKKKLTPVFLLSLLIVAGLTAACGPGRSSTVTALYAYDVAFKTKQLSYASAVSIGMIILSVILIGGVSRIFREKEEQ